MEHTTSYFEDNASEALEPNEKDTRVPLDQVVFLDLEELQGRLSKNTHVIEEISSDNPIESPVFPNLSERDEVLRIT